MVKDGENGYTFNPVHDNPRALAEILARFIDNPDLIRSMGERSKKTVSSFTPETAANHLRGIIEFVLGSRDGGSRNFGKYPQKLN